VILEKEVERHLVKKVKEQEGLAIKLLAVHFVGLPDRLVLLPKARMFFVELKRPKAKPRKIQLYVHDLLRSLGFDVRVIDSKEKVDAFIQSI